MVEYGPERTSGTIYLMAMSSFKNASPSFAVIELFVAHSIRLQANVLLFFVVTIFMITQRFSGAPNVYPIPNVITIGYLLHSLYM